MFDGWLLVDFVTTNGLCLFWNPDRDISNFINPVKRLQQSPIKCGTAAVCRAFTRFYHFHAFSLRVHYLQQLIETDRHGEDKSRRFSTSRDERAGNEFITVVIFIIIIINTYSKLCSYGRTACAIALNTVRGGQTETQMLRQIRDVIRIENLRLGSLFHMSYTHM